MRLELLFVHMYMHYIRTYEKAQLKFAAMKISIEGFKSIKNVVDFEFSPLTLLAGVNSSGKSSLIQVLLLLKQTLNSKDIVYVNGPYVYAESVRDLLFGKKQGDLKIVLSAMADEMQDASKRKFAALLGKKGQVANMTTTITFRVNGKVKLTHLNMQLNGKQTESYSWQLDALPSTGNLYELHVKQVTLDGVEHTKDIDRCVPRFENFIPLYIEENQNEDASVMGVSVSKSVATEALLFYLREMLNSLFYIKALRVEPDLKKSYNTAVNRAYIDPDGQNLQFVYNEKKNDIVRQNETLSQALVRWLSAKFQLSQNIEIKQDEEKLYHTLLRMQKGLDVDLCQVGFGVSQVLPILVQGLLTPKGGTLIVEDPEVHMHPSVQAGLVDFFIEMIKDGKRVIIETHSDHIITRLRRRIAEKAFSPADVNLCFVSMVPEQGSLYTTIDVQEQGNLRAPLPKGFLDVQDEDFRAILHAKLEK